jgi:uncharacterized glyoxalase superfamily protein PhnB
MEMKSLAPVLVVEAIEPCLAFWTERLGFAQVAEVEHEGRLGFVILAKDAVQVMLQTRASISDDMPSLEPRDLRTSALLYLSVADIDAAERALEGVPVVIARRTTFYGATEIGVREPSGNVILFAQHA